MPVNNSSFTANRRVVKTACNQCNTACGVVVHVQDGRVVKVEGDREHPANRGALCPKGSASAQLLYHAQRLNHPLKRINEKGARSEWREISWNEALTTIANRLNEIKEKHGSESICIASAAWAHGNIGISSYFAYALGTPNYLSSNYQCYGPHCVASQATTGIASGITTENSCEFADSNCILLWGSNPSATIPYLVGAEIQRAKDRGAKLIVVNPKSIPQAKRADVWLQVKPGTDAALALGMLNVIINEKLHDKGFVGEYCVGFDKLETHVQKYSPEKVAEATWVSRNDIVEAARMFAENKPATLRTRVALDHSRNSVQTLRAIYALAAVCGCLDVKGGISLLRPAVVPEFVIGWYEGLNKLPSEVKMKTLGFKEFPLYSGRGADTPLAHPNQLFSAILKGEPYPVKALITVCNLAMFLPNTRKVLEALRRLDFTVTIDLFMTPTAELADIVLPAACYLERDGLWGCDVHQYLVSVAQKAVEPLYERWDDVKIFIELAKKMGLSLPWRTVEQYNDYRLQPLNLKFEEAKGRGNYIQIPKEYGRYRESGFPTPSGKVELYSSLFEEYGYEPLPTYVEPPQATSEYPLAMVTGDRVLEFWNSEGRQISMLRHRRPDPLVEVHPETAGRLNIEDGDWVFIESFYLKNEKGRFKAKLTTDVHPKVVHVPHGWWYPEMQGPEHGCLESNVNVIIPDDVYDPIIGSPNMKSIPCRIHPAP